MTAFAPDIPVITTNRLILRAPREADWDAMAAFGRSDRSKWVGGPMSVYQSWGALLSMLGHWVLRGYGMWMLEHRETGQTAGRVGMIFNAGWDEPELGWHIYEGFEGQGLAFEAAQAARDFAAREQGLDGVISYVNPANTRSVRLAERLGAVHERDGTLMEVHEVRIYRHPTLAQQERAA